MILTGVMLFLSESVKCYYSQAFWVKITTLPLALIFTFAIRQRVIGVEGVARSTERLTGGGIAAAVVRGRRGRALDRLLVASSAPAELPLGLEVSSVASSEQL